MTAIPLPPQEPAWKLGTPTAATKPAALVATRSALMAMGFRCLFRDHPQVRLLDIVDNAPEAQALWRQEQPHMVLMDAEFSNAFSAAQWRSLPTARIALLWRFSHRGAQAFPAIERTCGLLRHSAGQGEAESVVRTLLHCSRPGASDTCSDCWLQSLKRPLELPLSPREQRVIELIGLGQTNQNIAVTLGLSVKTVESYREEIKRKLGLADAAALVKAALLWRMGEVPNSESVLAANAAPST